MDAYEVKLNTIAEIMIGYQNRSGIGENSNGDYSIIRPVDFNSSRQLVLDNLMKFSSTTTKVDPSSYLIFQDDILFQARGQTHMAYWINEQLENTVAANTFYVVRVRNQSEIIPSYLAWWINQPKLQAYFKKEQGVSTTPFISKAVLLNSNIRIPPIETQVKISKLMWLWQREKDLSWQLTKKKEIWINTVARKAAVDPQEVK